LHLDGPPGDQAMMKLWLVVRVLTALDAAGCLFYKPS